MAKVANIDRTATDSGVAHDNFANEVRPWLNHNSPMSALFAELGDGGYTLTGTQLKFGRDNSYRLGYIATDGFLPEPYAVDPVILTFSAARLYARGAVDNFVEEVAVLPDSYENYLDRIQEQVMDAVERGTTFHVHGSTAATKAVVTVRTSATQVTVDDGYGFDGAMPNLFIEPGMTLASHDANAGFAVLASAKVSTVTPSATNLNAVIVFATTIEGAGTIAAGDLLVEATTTPATDSHFVTERNRAPLGMLDHADPADAATTYGGLTEANTPRINPLRRASVDFGQVEIMEMLAEIQSNSQTACTPETHVLTMQPGVKIELAKELIPFQQMAQLGRQLNGGWTAVNIGGFDCVDDPYHVPTVVYFIPTEDAYVVDLIGKPSVWAGDGSQYSRFADYDAKEWFVRWYGQRFFGRRNRLGALTAVPNPNSGRFAANASV